jgi:hypothetical protein
VVVYVANCSNSLPGTVVVMVTGIVVIEVVVEVTIVAVVVGVVM